MDRIRKKKSIQHQIYVHTGIRADPSNFDTLWIKILSNKTPANLYFPHLCKNNNNKKNLCLKSAMAIHCLICCWVGREQNSPYLSLSSPRGRTINKGLAFCAAWPDDQPRAISIPFLYKEQKCLMFFALSADALISHLIFSNSLSRGFQTSKLEMLIINLIIRWL